MNKQEIIQHLRAEYIRHKEAGTASEVLLQELAACISSGEVSKGLLDAMQNALADNEQRLQAAGILQARIDAEQRGRALLEVFGDLLPLCLPQLASPLKS